MNYKGIKDAVWEFNDWVGSARIVLESDGENVNCEVSASGFDGCRDTGCSVLFGKGFTTGWDKVTYSDIKQILD